MADLPGEIELRILEVERRTVRIEDALRALDRRALAVGQGLWDAWSEVRVAAPEPEPEPPAGPTISGCSQTIPTTLYARDSVYGAITLTYDGSTMWTACKSVAFPGYTSGGCSVLTGVAVHYDLLKTGTFRMRWVSANPTTTLCPIASACGDATNVTAQQTNSVVIESCVPFRAHITVGIGGGFVILGNAANSGVRVDFSASPL